MDDAVATLALLAFLVWGNVKAFALRREQRRNQAILSDDRPDVLFLRSFNSDVPIADPFRDASLERHIRQGVEAIGDLVAVGQPDEGGGLPAGGAAARLFPGSDWQPAVAERIRSAPLVIVRAGVGAGLAWELDFVIRSLNPVRLLVLVLDLGPTEYEWFRGEFAARSGHPLPSWQELRDLGGPDGLITFTHQFAPTFIPLQLPLWRRVLAYGAPEFRRVRSALRKLCGEHPPDPGLAPG